MHKVDSWNSGVQYMSRPVTTLALLILPLLLAACSLSPDRGNPHDDSVSAPSAGAAVSAPEKQANAGGPAAEPFPGSIPVTAIDFPVVTRHQGVFNGVSVSYTATVAATEVADAEGRPAARIVSTAYIADSEPGPTARPVMFVWNGGPISPSVYLHMGAFGPKRVAFPDDLSADVAAAPLVDNPYSILDVADLVYFDPAGTGFSRTLPGKPLEDYFSVAADGQQTAAFIAAWLQANGRMDSPVYIFGESYGTNRAVETAGQLAQLPEPLLLDGVVLFGQAVNIIEYAQRPHNIISYVVSLPTLAAIGWHHGKAKTGGASLEDFVEQAWQYARSDYLDALFQGNSLTADQIEQVAERLQDFTGLRASVFIENRLCVSKELYRVELFREDGLIIGRSDGRYVGPAEPQAGGDGEPPGPPPDPAAALARTLAQAFRSYLVSDLGVPSADQYVIDSPVKGLNDWEWGGQTPFSRFDYGDLLDVLLEKYPAAQVLVLAGHQDTMTTTGASRYLVEQETWPRERVGLRFYRGGHMAYSVDDSAREMAEDLRALMVVQP
jgi:carboxypeptidase C (cathepsin A)